MVQNSYMLPHGTRPAASPRVTTPARCTTAASTITATATFAAGRRSPEYSIASSAVCPARRAFSARERPRPRVPTPVCSAASSG